MIAGNTGGDTYGNRLLAGLCRHELQLLVSMGENVRLVPGTVLSDRGEAAHSVFFPTSGAVLLEVPVQPSSSVGVLLVGSEGMVGIHCVLGDVVASMRAVVLTTGSALRIDARMFSLALGDSSVLRRSLLHYVSSTMNHIAASAACTRFHDIDARLAGWLLMCRDRARDGSFQLTQRSMALMLGVRREGITGAAHEMRRLHLIDYSCGDVTVLDVAGLRAMAGDCYFTDRPMLPLARLGRSRSVGRDPAQALDSPDQQPSARRTERSTPICE